LVASSLVNAPAAKLKLFHGNRKGFFRTSQFIELSSLLRRRSMFQTTS
jgi:hypothetical protein